MSKRNGAAEKEEEKARAQVQAAASARSSAARKKKYAQMKYYLAIGSAIGITVWCLWLAATSAPAKTKGESPLDKLVNDYYFIEGVNTDAGGNFTAAASPFFNKWKYADLKWGMNGVFTSNMVGMVGAVDHCDAEDDVESGAIPPAYDAREQFPECTARILDSGNCTSSYAVAAANALSMRYCVADSAKYAKLELSPQQILSCDSKSRGCKGGGIDSVWAYIQKRGLYPESCVPYKGLGPKAAPCKTTCDESKKLKIIDHCVLSGVKRMKRDIASQGPVVAPIEIMDSFLVYKTGVYTPQEGSKPVYGANGRIMKHAVSVVGWGRAAGVPYWIIQNSWGTSWGEDGFARVAINSIVNENYVVRATPATEDNLAKDVEKQKEIAARKEQAKLERQARDERIKARQAERDAAKKAEQEAQEDLDFDDDIQLDGEEGEGEAKGEGEAEAGAKDEI